VEQQQVQQTRKRKRSKTTKRRPKTSAQYEQEQESLQQELSPTQEEIQPVPHEQSVDTILTTTHTNGSTVQQQKTSKKKKKRTKTIIINNNNKKKKKTKSKQHFSTTSKIHEKVQDDDDIDHDVDVQVQVDVDVDVAWGQEEHNIIKESGDFVAKDPKHTVESNYDTKRGTKKRRKKKMKTKKSGYITQQTDVSVNDKDEEEHVDDLDSEQKESPGSAMEEVVKENHKEEEDESKMHTLDSAGEMMKDSNSIIENPTLQNMTKESNTNVEEEADDEEIDTDGINNKEKKENDWTSAQVSMSTLEQIEDATVGTAQNQMDESQSLLEPKVVSATSVMDNDDTAEENQDEEDMDHTTEPNEMPTNEETPMQMPSHDEIVCDDDDNVNVDESEKEEHAAQEQVFSIDDIDDGASDEESVTSAFDGNTSTSENDKQSSQNDKELIQTESVNVMDEGVLVLEDAAKILEMEKDESIMQKILSNSFDGQSNINTLEEKASKIVSFDRINDSDIVVEDAAERLQRDQDNNSFGGYVGDLVLEDAAQILRAELEHDEMHATDESSFDADDTEGINVGNKEGDNEFIPKESIDEESKEQSIQTKSLNVTAIETEETKEFSDDEHSQEATIDDFSKINESASNDEIQETSSAVSDGEQQEEEISIAADDTKGSDDANIIGTDEKYLDREDSGEEDTDHDEDSDDDDANDIKEKTTPSKHSIDQESNKDEDDSDDNIKIIDMRDSEKEEDSDDYDQDYGKSVVEKTTSSKESIDKEGNRNDDDACPPVEPKVSATAPCEISTEPSTSSGSMDNSRVCDVAVDSDSIPDSEITCSVVTWNLAESSPSESDAAFIKDFRKTRGSGSDFVLFGGQETENPKPRRTEGSRSRELRRILIRMLGKNYVPLALHSLGGVQFALFCKNTIVDQLEHVSIADVACGIGNVFHNKGAIGAFVQMKARNMGASGGNDVANRKKSVKMLFVACHLAAHVKKVDARNADYWRIVSELEAQAPPSFLSHREHRGHQQQETQLNGGEHLLDSVDHVIFCGDLNYRIDLPREFTIHTLKELTSTQNTKEAKSVRMSLLRHDQLLRTISEGRAFIGMSEGEITFPPTFKFDKGSHAYDTKKQRVPAWTDRILFRPRGVRVHEYRSVQSAMHSDHRPVYATLGLSMIGREMKPQTNVPKKRKRAKGQRLGV